jgi:DNA-binding NarL/FixJ family response regulator
LAVKGQPVRVAIVDDHPLVVDGLVVGLRSTGSIEVAGVARNASDAATLLTRQDVDVVLLDVRLGADNGLEVLANRGETARPYVLVLSSFNSRQYVAAASRLGASGFMLKTAPIRELVRAVRVVASGGKVFTPAQLDTPLVMLTARERDVVALTMKGMTNKEIADQLGTSRKAVEQHLSEIFARESIQGGRIELALRAADEAWLEIDAPTTRRDRSRQQFRR